MSKQIQNKKAGLYYRLSQEDERAGESLSIENQKKILEKYARENGFEIIDEYIDDGWSGTNVSFQPSGCTETAGGCQERQNQCDHRQRPQPLRQKLY